MANEVIESIKHTIKSAVSTVTDKYFVEISQVITRSASSGTSIFAPVLKEKRYLVYNPDETVDFTEDVHKATCFGYTLGTVVAKKIKSTIKQPTGDTEIQVHLVPMAAFVQHVQQGPPAQPTA